MVNEPFTRLYFLGECTLRMGRLTNWRITPFGMWLISDRARPLRIGLWDPFQMAELPPWLIQWGAHPITTYTSVLGAHPILQVVGWEELQQMRLHGELASAIRIHVVRLCVAFGVSHVVWGFGSGYATSMGIPKGPSPMPPKTHRKSGLTRGLLITMIL